MPQGGDRDRDPGAAPRPGGAPSLKSFYRCFRDGRAQAEINPLVITEDGDLVALDAKMTFDDNTPLYKRADIVELRDFDEEDHKEVDATGHGLNYIALDGSVGCIVNGAGLAMGTMDAITHHGGRPANFLDVGGGAIQKTANAFRIVLQRPERARDPREHLRRHQPLRLDRHRHRPGHARPGDRRTRSSSASPGRTSRR